VKFAHTFCFNDQCQTVKTKVKFESVRKNGSANLLDSDL